jgi:hypothetical protein
MIYPYAQDGVNATEVNEWLREPSQLLTPELLEVRERIQREFLEALKKVLSQHE